MKFKINKNVKINNEKLFLFTYDIFLITGIISVSMLASIIVGAVQKGICLFELLILILIEFRIRRWDKKEVIFGAICVLLFLLSYSKNPVEVAVMFIFVFCSRNYSFKTIAIHTYKISLIMLLSIIALSEIGVIREIVFEDYRYSAGFRYVLYGPSLLLNIVFLKAYIKGISTKWYELVFYFLFSIFLLGKCHANLSFGLTIIFIVYMFYYKISKIFKSKQHTILRFFSYSFIFLLIMSFASVYYYSKNQDSWSFIDHVLSGRLQLSLRALTEYSINFFGNNIEWVGNGVDAFGNAYTGEYYYVDNAYINSTLELGLLFSIIIWGMYTEGMKKCKGQNERLLMVILITISVYFVFDNLKLKLIYNTFWLVLPKLLLGKPLDSSQYLSYQYIGEKNESTI